MRAIVTAVFLAAAVFAGSAVAQPGGDQASAFPRDEASLRDLDSQQLRIVRRAGAQCWHSGQGGFTSRSAASRACIIGSTESAVNSSDNAALYAYHNALPFNARYNEYRPAYYWQRFVQR
jgi:hypothetical protein